ncbi:methyltransferase domain-containing protein [Nocardioides sp. HDW12B]|uniref:methyltransferase domain-containing protein n=1 Tax=Nocardioides sp. HDW12B TaxID=2714939 RepID=UPI00140B911A|nr:methyltransferase domain-containing protein [Nocardioides sp. HDW12B]QIK66905.1 methyltransferase domain-containing protein [Nocardioides sp. HDW12B]
MSAPGSARSTQSAHHRRSSARTAVVWDALRPLLGQDEPLEVLDIGGGTGGFAVGVAELGHHVVVVDPSPDALATLARRSAEAGVADRVRGVQGDLATLADLAPADGADVVLCHGVLEVVDDPRAALASIHDVLRPGGTLSLLVSQRHAAVLARAMAGHFRQAHELLDADGTTDAGTIGETTGPRRFTAEEIRSLLAEVGLGEPTLHAVRVFGDLVPSSLVDLEPGAAAALASLEQAVSTRPEYLALATQVHALARRGD